jgi:hypothetical protein
VVCRVKGLTLKRRRYTSDGRATMHPSKRQWWAIYAVTAVVCVAVFLTAGTSDDSGASHAIAIIVIAGVHCDRRGRGFLADFRTDKFSPWSQVYEDALRF